MSTSGPIPPQRAITRRDLELVIRRAVELATESSDAGDAISEDELVRIGKEVGLSPEYVRQAMFDLPTLGRDAEPTTAAKVLGPATVSAQRVVPGDPDSVLRRLDQYLTTQEFLQRRRMQPGQAVFEPAEDVFSKVARGFTRSNARFYLARASRVGVSALPAEDGRARLRIELDLDKSRKDTFVGAGVGGSFAGVGIGGGLGLITAAVAGGVLHAPVEAAIAGGILVGLSSMAGTIAAGFSIARRKFTRRLQDARAEIEGLLDKIQSGERLEPPPNPLVRRLRDKFMGAIPPLR